MTIYWNIRRDGKIFDKGVISAHGFDEAVEDKLIPNNPHWQDNDEIEIYSKKKYRYWNYRVKNWRKV